MSFQKIVNTLVLGMIPFPLLLAPTAVAVRSAVGSGHSMTLSYSAGQTTGSEARRAMLTCHPPGGTHRAPAEACQALDAVGGDPAALNVSPDVLCPQVYEPVTVTATGSWDGRTISFSRTFGNACEAAAVTGPVFNLGV